jgi:alanine-synthesizing transaminase
MFSSRTPRDLAPNSLARCLERKRAAGETILDLTESNPTRSGFDYPAEAIRDALASPAGLRYDPDPRGLPEARRAVAAYYAERGVAVSAERILLTASTSEAYALLFKVLLEPGDRVLTPVPSYPLFDHLARAESIVPVSYPLALDGAWSIDFTSLREALDERTRAIIVVSPNNPTGSCLTREELAMLVELCAERELALICDEVFSDYVVGENSRRAPSVADSNGALTFALSGLSKVAALPQVKAGWIVANGPDAMCAEALARLEFLADLFLSVSTPVQCALPRLLELAPGLQGQIRARLAENRAWLAAFLGAESAVRALPADGGWYAVLRIPLVVSEEELVLELLDRAGVLVHPGYFFDFEREGWLVVSLLTLPGIFRAGIERVVECIHDHASRTE